MKIWKTTFWVGALALVFAAPAPAREASHHGAGHEAGGDPVHPAARAPSPETGGHAETAHAEHGSASASHGLAQAWSALREARDALAKDVEAGRLEGIHERTEPLAALVQSLLEHSGTLEAAQRARVEAAARQMVKVAAALHEAADGGDTKRSLRELHRLDSLLTLMRAQYPSGALAVPRSPSSSGSTSSYADPHSSATPEGHTSSHGRDAARIEATPRATLRVRAREFRFDPSEFVIQPGEPTRIELVNEGAIEHAFVIENSDERAQLVHLHAAPGATDSGTFELDRPGRYAVRCTIPGHSEAGMVGEVVVTSRSAVSLSPQAR